MTAMHDRIRTRSLLQLAIPGSHDSAMYKEGMGKVLGPDSEPEVVKIFERGTLIIEPGCCGDVDTLLSF